MVEWSFYGRGIRALFNNISWSMCVHAGGYWMRRSVTLASRVLSNFPGAALLDRRTLTMDQSLYIALTIFHRILVFPNPFKAYRHTFQLSRYVISVRPWDYGVRWWLKLCDFDVIHPNTRVMGFVLQIRWQDSQVVHFAVVLCYMDHDWDYCLFIADGNTIQYPHKRTSRLLWRPLWKEGRVESALGIKELN